MKITILLLAAAAFLAAQEPVKLAFFEQAVPGPFTFQAENYQFVSGQMVGSSVKASPYSAESVVESVQVLADGNRIVNRTVTKLFRDSEGRERREMPVGENNAMIMVTDPVAGESLTWHTNEKTVEKMPHALTAKAIFIGAGTEGPLTARTEGPLTARIEGPMGAGVPGTAGVRIRTESRTIINNGGGRANANEENLGAKTIEGVMAQGTRVRNTIPAGQIGNDKPIEIVTETWYSPDLQMTVLSETSDPRIGKSTMKLTNISRSEPSRALFEVPAGYAVQDAGKLIHDDVIRLDNNEPGQSIQIIQRGPKKLQR